MASETFDDGQPQPGPLRTGTRCVTAPERALGGFEFGFRQTRALVGDGEIE